MQLNAQQKRLAIIIALVFVGITILIGVLIRVNNIRTLRTPLTIQNSANINATSLTSLQNMWPLTVSPQAGVYGFLCAVTEIIEENNGRPVTSELEAIYSVNCKYLASDGSEQTLLVPLAFRHTSNGEISSIIYGFEPVPASMRTDEIRIMLERDFNLVPGKVILVNFNSVNELNSQLPLSDYLSTNIEQVISDNNAQEFARTGNPFIFGDNFIARLVTFDSFIGPQTIN